MALMLFAASAVPAAAQSYPPAVLKVIAEAREACGTGGRFTVIHDGIERVDVFSRGVKDYVLSDDSWSCEGMQSMFSGSGGSTHWIVSDIRGRHEVIFEGLIRAVTYDGKGRLTLSLHGSSCNRSGAEPCTRRLAWDGRRLAPARPR
ncbi:MAG: hypothetical protein ACRCTI_11320 [Beijerinckiaceae bacterium]